MLKLMYYINKFNCYKILIKSVYLFIDLKNHFKINPKILKIPKNHAIDECDLVL